MTAPKATKRKGCASGVLARNPLCNLMLACDGNTLTGAHKALGYCGRCKEALDRKNKPPPPLKGENTALNEKVRKLLPANWNSTSSDDD